MVLSKQPSIVIALSFQQVVAAVIPPYKEAHSASVLQWQETGHTARAMLQGRDAGAQPEMGTQMVARPSNRKCTVRLYKPGSEKEELAELTSFS